MIRNNKSKILESSGKYTWSPLSVIDLTDYSLYPMASFSYQNTYSCFVLSSVENYFVIEPKNSEKQIRRGKHGNIIFICP